MTSTTEILNIEYHQRRLLLRALNTLPRKADARRATGLPERTFFNMIEYYKIVKKDGKYISEKEINYLKISVCQTTYQKK